VLPPGPIADAERQCLVIAEVAQAHDGSLGMAHAYVDAVAAAGADAVKFQTHIAEAESTPAEPWRVRFSAQDETRYDYWKRTGFTESQWQGLKQHAVDRGIVFMSTPFSAEAAAMLMRVGVGAWKVASGELSNLGLLDQMGQSALPVILSTGMSPLSEVDAAVERMRRHGVPIAVLQCTSQYPCEPHHVGLNLLELFRRRYGCPVGLSDHTGTIYPALAGAALGINVLEVHVTLSREMFGPDVRSSVTTAELKQLVEGVSFIEQMMRSPVQKDAMAEELSPMRGLFTKSLVARVDLRAGTVLTPDLVTAKKPGTGIPARRLHEFLHARVRRDVSADSLLTEDDFER
jgi:N-acetylneuraminate synthase